MKNFQLGKIYKIVCHVTGKVYVGSTREPTLSKMIGAHRSVCKSYYETNKRSCCASFQIILRGEYYIDLDDNFLCNSNDELFKNEGEWYNNIECINKIRPY